MYKSQHHHIELLHYPEDPLCSAHSSVHLCKPVAIADLLIAFSGCYIIGITVFIL